MTVSLKRLSEEISGEIPDVSSGEIGSGRILCEGFARSVHKLISVE